MDWMYNTPHLEADVSVWKGWVDSMTLAVKNGTDLPYFKQAIDDAKEHISWVEARLASGKSWGENKAEPKKQLLAA